MCEGPPISKSFSATRLILGGVVIPDSISGLFGAFESDMRWSKLFLVPAGQMHINLWCRTKRTDFFLLQLPVNDQHKEARLECMKSWSRTYPEASWCWPGMAGPCQGSLTCVCVDWSGPRWGRDGPKGSDRKPEATSRAEFRVVSWHGRDRQESGQHDNKAVSELSGGVLEIAILISDSKRLAGEVKVYWGGTSIYNNVWICTK